MPLLGSELSLAVVNTRDECVVAGPGDGRSTRCRRACRPTSARDAIPLAAAGAQLAARPDPARVPRSRPRGLALGPRRCGTSRTSRARGSRPSRRPIRSTGSTTSATRCASPTASQPSWPTARSCWPSSDPATRCRRSPDAPTARRQRSIAGLRHPNQVVDDTAFSLLSFARLWGAGVDVDLERFAGTGRRRLRLPDLPVPARALLDRARRRLHRHHADRRHRSRPSTAGRARRHRERRAASTISTTCSGSPRGSRATRRPPTIAAAPGSSSATRTTRSSARSSTSSWRAVVGPRPRRATRPRASTTRSTAS